MNPAGRQRDALPDDAILRAYLDGATETKIARALGVGRTTVHRRLVSSGVELRGAAEARALTCHRDLPLGRLRAVVDGLLLGDGYCEDYGRSESRLAVEQRAAKRDWLDGLVPLFAAAGFDSGVQKRKTHRPTLIDGVLATGGPVVLWRTGKYVTWSRERDRWYPNGKKIVPADVDLSDVSLAHWYWGDGVTEGRGNSMGFCTEGFSSQDIDLLVHRLHELYGWKVCTFRRRNGRRLQINRLDDRVALLRKIRPNCPMSFRYKIDRVREE